MALWTSYEIKKATGGVGTGNWTVNGVSIDSRTIQIGDLFVALTDKRDGHDFVMAAFEKGAAAALVSSVPEGFTDDPRFILVVNVLEGLKSLAVAARKRFSGKLIAVTGSVGKTSTKEMLRVALETQGIVHASDKSFNNHWGVPLTLARMPKNTDFAIIEMGMNQSGEIRAHSLLSEPHIALITEVQKVHMQNFRNLQEIALAKSEIFSGLKGGGLALVNSDIKDISTIESSIDRSMIILQKFGTKGPDWILNEVIIKDNSLEVKAIQGSTTFEFLLNSLGQHFALNALATIAVVNFGSGGASLNAEAKATLDAVVEAAQSAPADASLLVVGHADGTPVLGGRYRSNWGLSQARADAVSKYLKDWKQFVCAQPCTLEIQALEDCIISSMKS